MKRQLLTLSFILLISLLIFWIGSSYQNVDCGPECPIDYDWNALLVIFSVLAGGYGILSFLNRPKSK